MHDLKALVEGLIFLSGEEGLSMIQIQNALQIEENQKVQDALLSLKEEYASSSKGIELVEYASRYKFVTKNFVYPFGQKLFENIQHPTLSQAAIETLAIIAYKQPVTKAEIEQIRGVSCSHAINKLLEYGLITEAGRLNAPGRPILLATTEEFLRTFGVQSVENLPSISPEELDTLKTEAEEEVQMTLDV